MWFEYFTERVGGPTVFEAMASGPRRVDAVRRGQGRDEPDGFVGVHVAVPPEPELRQDEARVSGPLRRWTAAGDWPDATVATPTDFYSVNASGNSKGERQFQGPHRVPKGEMANDGYVTRCSTEATCPWSPTSSTAGRDLEGTRNAVFARYVFGGQR
jgi:hypothetical protein